jgi:hypothetical protein
MGMASAFSEMLWSGLKARKATIPHCNLIPKATLTHEVEKTYIISKIDTLCSA